MDNFLDILNQVTGQTGKRFLNSRSFFHERKEYFVTIQSTIRFDKSITVKSTTKQLVIFRYELQYDNEDWYFDDDSGMLTKKIYETTKTFPDKWVGLRIIFGYTKAKNQYSKREYFVRIPKQQEIDADSDANLDISDMNLRF